MKKITLFITCLLLATVAYSQKEVVYNQDSVHKFVTKFHWSIFKTSDSIYKFTTFQKENGHFFFGQGFIDSTYSDNLITYLSDRHPFFKQFKLYSIKYSFFPLIDTIQCILPIAKKFENFTDSVRENKHCTMIYPYTNYLDELQYSYILKQLGEKDIRNSKENQIRMLDPHCYYRNRSCSTYDFVKAKLYKDSAKLYSKIISWNGFSEVKILANDSCVIKNRQFKKIMKELNQFDYHQKNISRIPTVPTFSEINYENQYKHFIISPYGGIFSKKYLRIPYLFRLIYSAAYKQEYMKYMENNATDY